jgi:hypothetical protein
MKLNSDAPAQHKALLAVAGVLIFLSLVDVVKGGSDKSNATSNQVVLARGSKYQNPTLSWYDRIFCRGYQRSLSCGYNFYHPLRDELESQGKRIKEKKAPDGVVLYRGRLEGVKGNWEESR